MAKPQRFCIFCGSSGLTREHIWPEWFGRLLPEKEMNHVHIRTMPSERSVVISPPSAKRKQGDVSSKKIKVVCKTCNETWMSNIETTVIPIMTPLIQGQQITLTLAAQQILARWMTMKTIVAEYDNPLTQSIPESARHWFKEHQRPPEGWQIWISSYHGVRWQRR